MESKRILVVEDDQFLREFYEELLSTEGYIIDTAADGDIGFSKLRSNKYDLVLLDIMLPKKDGVQILKDLKLNPSQSGKTTIVILTNLGQDLVIKECFNLGASGYLIKSALNPDQVLTEVKSFLQQGSNAS